MIEIDAAKFVAGLDAMAAAFPAAVDQYGTLSAEDAHRDLLQTSTFQNRTYALRNAFSMAGTGEEWRVFIDPSASPRRGKTPPAEYGMYLNDGTSRISARRFLEHAAETLELSAVLRADDVLGAWVNGAY